LINTTMNNEQLLQNILDVTPFACVLMADTLEIKYMNPIMSEFFSLNSEKSMTGASFFSYLSEEEQESFLTFIQSLGESQPTQSWQRYSIVDADGDKKSILFNGIHNLQNLGSEGVYFLVGIPVVEDIMENMLTDNLEEKIRNRFSKSKYDSIIDSATIGITILNHEGNVEDTNQTFAAQIGQAKGEIIEQHYSHFFNNESIQVLNNLLKDITEQNDDLAKGTLTITHPDGSHNILDISISRVRDVERHQGKFMVITEDITEKEDTHAALLQSEKLALTGRLAASLAHEINNPLQTSIGCLGLADEILGERDDDLRVYIKMAMEELQRSARIVKKLRDLNRKSDNSEKSPVNLQEILEGVLVLTKNRLYDRNIVPIFPYQGPPPYALAARDQIQQVLLNLVMNAIDALPEGGNIYLDLVKTQAPEGYQIKIRDTGQGIPPEMMDNLFDPFFTTKDDGLGLGLYISQQIIEDHEGSISVESKPGKGTVFTIWLPGIGSN